MLWGAFAQSKEKLIDEKKHFILKTTHPSPFSAHRGFIGSDCFKKTNEILEKIGKKPINWEIKS
ncbi:uracil-DNA glycosylase [Candidatus Gracilibacteria bacterium]|nr:MAG: uracil-DNA glycosylase [Candidatus Gracilibacteria bacterium]